MEANELDVHSKHSVWKQYRLIYRDSCYRSLSIAASLSYGVTIAIVFLLHQNRKTWDTDRVWPTY